MPVETKRVEAMRLALINDIRVGSTVYNITHKNRIYAVTLDGGVYDLSDQGEASQFFNVEYGVAGTDQLIIAQWPVKFTRVIRSGAED